MSTDSFKGFLYGFYTASRPETYNPKGSKYHYSRYDVYIYIYIDTMCKYIYIYTCIYIYIYGPQSLHYTITWTLWGTWDSRALGLGVS